MFRRASLFIGTSFTVADFTIFATSNLDLIVGIPHKIYSMQRILIHIKADLFVKCAHLYPGYAANLVARSRYYHCHWTLLSEHPMEVMSWAGSRNTKFCSLSRNIEKAHKIQSLTYAIWATSSSLIFSLCDWCYSCIKLFSSNGFHTGSIKRVGW